MSETLSNLEVEPEWCSAAMLTSISATEVPIVSPVEVSTSSPSFEPVVEVASTEMVESVETPKIETAPVKPKQVPSKSRFHSETDPPISSKQPTGQSRWLGALRSRKFRIVATVASVLLVGGLIILNSKSDKSASDDGIAEMDLLEFDNVASFDEPHTNAPSKLRPRGTPTAVESVSPAERFPRMTSGPRLPPQGLVIQADHEAPAGQPPRGLVPASASSTGSRGAVLTGRIEFDVHQRSAERAADPFRNHGMR